MPKKFTSGVAGLSDMFLAGCFSVHIQNSISVDARRLSAVSTEFKLLVHCHAIECRSICACQCNDDPCAAVAARKRA